MHDDDEMLDDEHPGTLHMGDEDAVEDEDEEEDDLPYGMHEVEEDGSY
jgi:hypothetical protein